MALSRFRDGWVFGPRTDGLVFGGPVLAAGVLVAVASAAGRADDPLPPWLFLVLVVGCDVAHVWTTAFRTYLDPEERSRRGGLLLLLPCLVFCGGALLFAADASGGLFWRVLAYLAVWHFVRQQVGWMAYAGRNGAGEGPVPRAVPALDRAAVYAATLGPVVWWHASLPRSFRWFTEGDFVPGLPREVGVAALVLSLAVVALWALRQAVLVLRPTGPCRANRAQWLVLGSTCAAWYGGIVVLDSDLAFTATNVLAHGVPYVALVRRWGTNRFRDADAEDPRTPVAAAFFRPGTVAAAGFVVAVLAVAWAEEALWDRLVWRDHGGLFPFGAANLPPWAIGIAVPLLAVPQGTHYLLDAWIWRTGPSNPGLAARLRAPDAP